MDRIWIELERLDRNLTDRLSEIYDRIAQVGLLLLAVLVANVVLNCTGIRITSIVVALIGVVAILYRAYDPWILLRPLGVAYILTELGDLGEKVHLLEKEEKKDKLIRQVLKIYNEIILETLLWFCFLSLIIGIFPMWGRLKAGLIVVLALVTFKIAAILLKKPPIFAKVAHAVSIIIFIAGIGYMAVNYVLAFPSVQARIGWVDGFNLLPPEQTAEVINLCDEKLKEKRIEVVSGDIINIKAQQINNPAYVPTPSEEAFLAQARKGGLKTLAEVNADLAEKPKPAAASTEKSGAQKAAAEIEPTLVRTLVPQQAGYGTHITLPPGQYSVKPGNTNSKKTRILLEGETEYRTINGKSFVVENRPVKGIITDWPVLKIYRQEAV